MAVHLRDIKIKAYTAPDNKPTCRNIDGICLFYRTSHFGTIEKCCFDDAEIKRKDGKHGQPNMGHTVVTATCPVWNRPK